MEKENLPRNPETNKRKNLIQLVRLKIGNVLEDFPILNTIGEILSKDLSSPIISTSLLSLFVLCNPNEFDFIKTISPYVLLGLGEAASNYLGRAAKQQIIYEEVGLIANTIAPIPQILRAAEGKYVVKERIENEREESLQEIKEGTRRINTLFKRITYLNKASSVINILQVTYAFYLVLQATKFREALKTIF